MKSNKKSLYLLFFSGLFFLFNACKQNTNHEKSDNRLTTNSSEPRKEYTIGIVPQYSNKRIFSIWSPILEALEKETNFRFKIVGYPTIPDFEKGLKNGAYDLGYMNPYHAVVAHEAQGYEAVLRDASKELQGILVVRKDQKIKEIAQLDSQSIAFPAPNALGASLLMRTELANIHGLNIQPLYVNTHTDTYMSVYNGATIAGGGVMRTFNALNEDVKATLEIFYKTQPTPPHPLVIHPRVDGADREKIVIALLKMSENETGQALLAKIPIQKLASTSQKEYNVLKKLGMEKFYVSEE